MILLQINLVIAILTLIMFYAVVIEASYEFKRRYPDIKIPKKSFIEYMCTIFKNLVLCIIPVINLALFLTVMFNGENLKEQAINKVYLKYR